MHVAWLKDLRLGDLDRRIAERLEALDADDVEARARCGAEIRGWIEQASFPARVEKELRSYYQILEAETSRKR